MGDELLALLVPVERVVCVSQLVDDAETSNVAGHFPAEIPRLAARVEPVLAAGPDAVIAAPWNGRAFLDLLERSGRRAIVLDEVRDLEDIRAQLLRLGAALGEEERAERVAATFDSKLARVDSVLGGAHSQPRVLAFSHSVVAGSGTTVDAMIRRAGGVNAAAEAGIEGHVRIRDEQLVALDPDVLLLGYDPGEEAGIVIKAYPQLGRTRAARAGSVIVLDPRQLTTASPFIVDGVLALARELHPRLFRQERRPGTPREGDAG
jgi:iron complex transport system substrate-binding protein